MIKEKDKVSADSLLYQRRNITKFISVVILLLSIIIFSIFLNSYDTNIIIILLVDIFLFLTFLGLILKESNHSLKNRLFPSSIKKSQKNLKQIEKDVVSPERKNIRLDFQYKKPLISKCAECGMILTNFMKKCPNCQNSVK